MSAQKAGRASGNFFTQALQEIRKVTWPSREDTLRMTCLVLIVSLVLGLLIGGLDFLFTEFLQLFVNI